ncbi:unnamed protein product [Prunus armeniaca]
MDRDSWWVAMGEMGGARVGEKGNGYGGWGSVGVGLKKPEGGGDGSRWGKGGGVRNQWGWGGGGGFLGKCPGKVGCRGSGRWVSGFCAGRENSNSFAVIPAKAESSLCNSKYSEQNYHSFSWPPSSPT